MKTFKLFKRSDERDAPYYIEFVYRGKRYMRCLETPNAEEGQRRARIRYDAIVRAVQSDNYAALDKTKLRRLAAGTVGQLLDAYQLAGVDAVLHTRNRNGKALQVILRSAFPQEDTLKLPLFHINGDLAANYLAAAAARATAEPDQQAAIRIRRTANSTLAQARAVFAPRARPTYEAKGLWAPCLAAFYETYNTRRFTRLPKTGYTPPPDAVITATLTAWRAIDSAADRNLFLAVGLELAFGLRIGEIGQARWSWLTARNQCPCIDTSGCPDVHVKNHTGLIQVRALDPYYTDLMTSVRTHNWQGKPDEYILTGSDAVRTDDTFRRVSAWMHALGWQTTKTNHALRAYAGSQVAMKYSIYEAQTWLRHSTVTVTESHYSQFVKALRGDPDQIPVQWATVAAATAPQFTILPPAVAASA